MSEEQNGKEQTARKVSRRRVLSAGGLTVAALGGVGLVPAAELAQSAKPASRATSKPEPAASHAAAAAHERFVTVTEGTNIAAAVSPDGRTVAFDLYGQLWLVGIEGGTARRLTDDLHEIAQPDWAPDSASLIFQSYRDGNFHIWSIGADGSGLKQLTQGPHDCREPRFSPDGRRIAYSSDPAGRYAVHVLDLTSGQSRPLTAVSKVQESEPAWSPDGKSIAFLSGHDPDRDLEGAKKPKHEPARVVTRPEFRWNNEGFTDFRRIAGIGNLL